MSPICLVQTNTNVFGAQYVLCAVHCCPIILPRENESVLLGASILDEVAAKKFSSLNKAMKAMNAVGQFWGKTFHMVIGMLCHIAGIVIVWYFGFYSKAGL
uniref:Uncharacterized protein n=1 Tax=Quercus lobata TaxID=97700 RepID=A0A7N2L2R2_QUELO